MAKSDQVTDSNIFWLKPAQVEAMRDAAHEGRHGQRDEAIVTLLYDTGLRRNELSLVDRAMLDLDEEELRIPAGIQKDYPNENSPSPVTFALDPSEQLRTGRTLRAHLNARTDGGEALFPSQKGSRMTGKGINDVVKRLATRAAIAPYT
jgi:site-specific recombinase XerD